MEFLKRLSVPHLKLVVLAILAKTQVKPDFLTGDHVTVDADLS